MIKRHSRVVINPAPHKSASSNIYRHSRAGGNLSNHAKTLLLSLLLLAMTLPLSAGEFDRMVIPRVKYDGGGDW